MRRAIAIDESNLPPEDAEFHGTSKLGHPLIVWPGWQNNDARYSVQPDIIPVPIEPVHFQQWTGMQYQLSNGWQFTNYGKRAPYDLYRRMLYSSISAPGAPRPLPGEGRQPTGFANSALVSQKTIQNTVLVNNESPSPSGFSNVGRRTYYG